MVERTRSVSFVGIAITRNDMSASELVSESIGDSAHQKYPKLALKLRMLSREPVSFHGKTDLH